MVWPLSSSIQDVMQHPMDIASTQPAPVHDYLLSLACSKFCSFIKNWKQFLVLLSEFTKITRQVCCLEQVRSLWMPRSTSLSCMSPSKSSIPLSMITSSSQLYSRWKMVKSNLSSLISEVIIDKGLLLLLGDRKGISRHQVLCDENLVS